MGSKIIRLATNFITSGLGVASAYTKVGFMNYFFAKIMGSALEPIFEHGFPEKISRRFIPHGLAGFRMDHLP
jgi:hypothetical protein